MSAAQAISPAFKLKVKVVAGPHLNEIYTLEKNTTKIGRGEDNDIKLVNDGRISRNHVEIYLVGGQYKFKNISQKNFVMIDGRVVEDGVLQIGQQLQVGETVFEVYNDNPGLVSNEVPKGEMTVKVSVQPAPMPVAIKQALLQKNPTSQSAPVSTGKPPTLKPLGPTGGAPQLRTMPQPGVSSRPQKARRPAADGNRSQFYGILLVVAGIFLFILMQPSKEKDIKTFRTSQQVEYDLLQSSDEKKRLQERLETMQTTTAKRSQENLIKGFRDFQQGNYARARDNFQVVLNLDPENAIAKRYYHLSKIKFDELLQFHMLQGLRYRDKKNFRLCRSSFQSALVMIQNSQQHPKYREIKNFFDECDLALEGRF